MTNPIVPTLGGVIGAMVLAVAPAPVLAQATSRPAAVQTFPHQLFVGTCYQPIDRSPEQIRADIAIMKAAGFNMVRMGDLSWDSFEPADGQFSFEWFDRVLDQMHAAGIKVILDIPGAPAPLWLHKKYPGIDVVNQHGERLHPATRYWDNIADPDYRAAVRRLAEAMLRRYAHHPAVAAVGYDNEVGNGQMSYSEADRQRFITWLKARYGTLDVLNRAWATQRWSRRISAWDEVELPYVEGPGPNERYLDLHRFWSDDTIAALRELDAVRQKLAPQLPTASNYWATAPKGFDWLRSYGDIATFGAQGFYPGDPLFAAFEVLTDRAASDRPVWLNEFTAGGGGYYGDPGRARMWAYFALAHYGQTFLAWTFNSHIGGEEQSLFGLVDHDGRPSWKVDEFGRIAQEFAKLKTLGFPRQGQAQVAIGYSFATNWLTNPPSGPNTLKQYFTASYTGQATAALQPLYEDNIDTAVIDPGHDRIDRYKLVILPSAYMMDKETAEAVHAYVAGGGTVIMTGYSAKVDETGKWFETPLPGRLADVFGLRTNAFYRHWEPLKVDYAGATLSGHGGDAYYEVLEPSTAKVLARFTNTPDKSPAITVNHFGKGRAIYLATDVQSSLLGPLVRSLYAELGVKRGPQTPAGVVAREVEGRVLYVNTNNAPAKVEIAGARKGVLTGKTYVDHIDLPPYGVELAQ
ncbi:MAG: beta-galactosidase [Pseudomonadota bacterium]